MEARTWNEILEELRVPFSPEIVSWKPQTVSRDRRRCLAVAYVETQPYQERLDRVCPDWQDDYAIWFSDPQESAGRNGERRSTPGKVFVKCRLTIAEHTRADVGECELTDENAFTIAKAQAFKRACAAFGLGRYLYNLPKAWVDYDDEKGIAENEVKRLEWALRRYSQGANGNGHAASAESEGKPLARAARPGSAQASPAGPGQPVQEPFWRQAVGTTRPSPATPGATEARGAEQPSASDGQGDQPTTPQATKPAEEGAPAQPASDTAVERPPAGRPGTRSQSRSARGAGQANAPVAQRDGSTTKGEGPGAEGQAAETPGPLEGGQAATADGAENLCPLHHVPLHLVITKGGKTLFLHKTAEGYCNGEVVRPARA